MLSYHLEGGNFAFRHLIAFKTRGAGGVGEKQLAKIKLLTVLAPLFYVVIAEFLRNVYLEPRLTGAQVRLVVFVSTLAGAMIFSELVFGLIQRMQGLLDRERERIEGIFHHTSDAVVLLDDHDRVVAMNPAGFHLTGCTSESIRTGAITAARLFADVPERSDVPWWQMARQGRNVPYFEAVLRSADGRTVSVTGSATGIPAPEGGTQVALIMRDISEKKALEAEVARRHRQAEGLYSIGIDLASLGDLEDSLKDVLRNVREILGARWASWAFIDEGTGDLFWKYRDADGEDGDSSGVAEAMAAQAVAERRPLVDTRDGLTVIAVPVIQRGRTFGALVVGADRSRVAESDTLFLSSVATQAAVALENRDLYARGQSQAILEERERVAKEMHDGFGQTLTYLTAMVATMEQLLRRGKVDEALARLAETREMLREAHQEVRVAIFNLRQRPSEEDFVAQVKGILDQFGRQSGIETDLVADVRGVVPLPFEKSIQVLRVIQEALANVRKHAGATRAVVTIGQQGGALEVAVSDNGCGFDPATVTDAGQHFGLHIMKERSQEVGGQLDIESAPGRGTTVRLRVPLRRWAQRLTEAEVG